MDRNKVEPVSKKSQAYILIKHGYSVRNTAWKIKFFCLEVVKTW